MKDRVPPEDPAWSGPSEVANAPLSGVRVIDASRVLAGPYAAMHLADLGAQVIKIETPEQGDETRRIGPPFSPDGTAAYFLAANRNKRSITLDLSHPDGVKIAQSLASTADVLIDNFMPGKLKLYGLDDQTLRGLNPKIITATISGFGSDNAYAGRPGYDFLAQAMGGMMSITGHPESGPTRVGVPINDLVAALYTTQAVIAGLFQRQMTGLGRHIEVSLLDSQVAILCHRSYGWLISEWEPDLSGNRTPSVAPYETFQTMNSPIAIAVVTDRQFRSFVTTIGAPHLAKDDRFLTNAKRVENRNHLTSLVEERLQRSPRDYWLNLLVAAGIPAAPVNSISEVFSDPVIRERMVADIDGDQQVRSPMRFDGKPLEVRMAPPALGADTNSILESLGYSAADIADLESRKIV